MSKIHETTDYSELRSLTLQQYPSYDELLAAFVSLKRRANRMRVHDRKVVYAVALESARMDLFEVVQRMGALHEQSDDTLWSWDKVAD